ncbi:hypothetical protein F0L74_21860 [Chitinophaga agrisoli]|uniref:YD repeat-containing protein n=1 Tax=Chitinophaga agrisoli TaxID=2607653 RepID=A0A5B2VH15_9BACT|nr:hypothetical protein [Chitinophaga agrisoli]KAA2238863.1 hypothetical protein F0L74_21860 [Chitinophaga agrisoli]
MKTFMVAPYCTFLMVTALLFTGCKKNDQPHGPAHCQIYKVKFYQSFNRMDSAVFTYNKKGDPIRITRGLNSTGAPDALFWYDKRGRLTDYIGIYAGGDNYEFRHRYTYDYKDRIVIDTMHVFGFLSSYPGSISSVTTYKYDAQDRIIRMDRRMPDYPKAGYSYLYTYNQLGNIEKITTGGGYLSATPVYDDKINMNNLHPVWQFLSMDYSRNNPFGSTGRDEQTGYDQYGLPIDIDKGWGSEGEFVNIFYSRMMVEYQCR